MGLSGNHERGGDGFPPAPHWSMRPLGCSVPLGLRAPEIYPKRLCPFLFAVNFGRTLMLFDNPHDRSARPSPVPLPDFLFVKKVQKPILSSPLPSGRDGLRLRSWRSRPGSASASLWQYYNQLHITRLNHAGFPALRIASPALKPRFMIPCFDLRGIDSGDLKIWCEYQLYFNLCPESSFGQRPVVVVDH